MDDVTEWYNPKGKQIVTSEFLAFKQKHQLWLSDYCARITENTRNCDTEVIILIQYLLYEKLEAILTLARGMGLLLVIDYPFSRSEDWKRNAALLFDYFDVIYVPKVFAHSKTEQNLQQILSLLSSSKCK